jgi:thiol:disulfide interchange protein
MEWHGYDDGLAEARRSKKPVCLIFYTNWCPKCAQYSQVFHDQEVVKQSRFFVMIRVERDSNQELSRQYSPDGTYVPRTFFLTHQGVLAPKIHEQRENYRYFYDPRRPSALLRGMKQALDKLE